MRKAIIYLLLFVLFLGVELLSGYYFKSRLSEAEIIEQVDKFTSESFKYLDETLQDFAAMDSAMLLSCVQNEGEELYSTRETEFLFYRNGKLVLWTDNRIPVPAWYDSTEFDGNFELFDNAYCLVRKIKTDDYHIIGITVLKNRYPYENENIRNDFNENLNIPAEITIAEKGQGTPLEYGGEELFYLHIPSDLTLSEAQNKILFILFVAALLFLFAFLYRAHKYLNPFRRLPQLFVLFYALDIIIIRILIAYFNFPVSVHNSMLFDPSVLAFNKLFPSIGDVFLNGLCLLAIMYAVFRELHFRHRGTNVVFTMLINILIYFFLFLSLEAMHWLIKGMVLDSSVMLNLYKIFSVDFYTIIAFLSLSIFITSLYLLLTKLLRFIRNQSMFIHALWAILIASGLYLLLFTFTGTLSWAAFLVYLVLLGLFSFQKYYMKSLDTVTCLMINVLIFASLITYLFQHYNTRKEQAERQVSAVKIASRQDPVAESMFLDIEDRIYRDDTLNILLEQEPIDEDLVISYVLYKYFDGYWDRYNYQATLCFPQDSLILKPDDFKQNCRVFFEDIINKRGHFTFSNNMFYLDTDPWFSNYIAKFEFPADSAANRPPLNLYLEMEAKYAPEGLVYPEMLVGEDMQRSELFSSEYSMAKYRKGELIAAIGNFNYFINLNDYDISKDDEKHFFEYKGFSHLYYPVSDDEIMIVSKYVPGFWETLAPFAYVLIFLMLFLLINVLIMNPLLVNRLNKNFKSRIQFIFFIIILVSFILIGVLSVIYLKNLNERKNTNLLKEKSHSILIEVEHKLSEYPELDSAMYPYVNDLMFKFAAVFFSDINMYDTDGMLIATSRPEVYEEGLVSQQINSDLLHTIRQQEKTIIIHKEKLGDLEYSSAYMPFRNNRNEVIAYLNLPYFARQNEMENEITNFLATFINLYVILLALALSFALLITGYITRPLNLIKDQMRKVKLGASNEKILWRKQDEIGELVNEYNKMIDELERSADLLMRSQRESAWREMAKQVAHEIKNPLTPMKLNIQMLQRSWDQNSPDWEKKLRRVTDSVIEQIDNLAAIASEFSDFAKMPISKPEIINLEDVINHSSDLYSNYDHVRISFMNNASDTRVKADYKQLIRVFNNILDNAVQAIPKNKNGMIAIEINECGDRLIVTVKDNGPGIPVEMQSKIFSPSFTTKSSGMGLGLTMVKSIVNNAGGRIWFESVENEGTIFYVELPQISE